MNNFVWAKILGVKNVTMKVNNGLAFVSTK